MHMAVHIMAVWGVWNLKLRMITSNTPQEQFAFENFFICDLDKKHHSWLEDGNTIYCISVHA